MNTRRLKLFVRNRFYHTFLFWYTFQTLGAAIRVRIWLSNVIFNLKQWHIRNLYINLTTFGIILYYFRLLKYGFQIYVVYSFVCLKTTLIKYLSSAFLKAKRLKSSNMLTLVVILYASCHFITQVGYVECMRLESLPICNLLLVITHVKARKTK